MRKEDAPISFRPWDGPDGNKEYLESVERDPKFIAFWGSINCLINIAVLRLRGKGDVAIEEAINSHRRDRK